MTSFRDRKKEGFEIQIPPELAEMIRVRAARERRSISEVGAEILLTGLGLDHAEFGITPFSQEISIAQTTE